MPTSRRACIDAGGGMCYVFKIINMKDFLFVQVLETQIVLLTACKGTLFETLLI